MKELFYILFSTGVLMVIMEIFLPGGILGTLGGIALAGAVITGFFAFPGMGLFIFFMVICIVAVCIVIWLKYFPKTPIGKSMTLSGNEKGYKSFGDSYLELLGKTGEAVTQLRPAGSIKIGGKKYSVVTRGSIVEKGQQVEVIKVAGNRLIVKEVKSDDQDADMSH
jgi:membrane-bound serine protease (ClpP class)